MQGWFGQAWVREADLFFQTFLLGMALRSVYDVFRVRRRISRRTRGWRLYEAAEDIFYWMMCGVVFFAVLLEINEGILRGFLYAALAGGMLLWHFGPSDLVVVFVCKIPKKITEIVKKPVLFLGKRLQKKRMSIKIKRNEHQKPRIKKREERRSSSHGKKEEKKETAGTDRQNHISGNARDRLCAGSSRSVEEQGSPGKGH